MSKFATKDQKLQRLIQVKRYILDRLIYFLIHKINTSPLHICNILYIYNHPLFIISLYKYNSPYFHYQSKFSISSDIYLGLLAVPCQWEFGQGIFGINVVFSLDFLRFCSLQKHNLFARLVIKVLNINPSPYI